MWTRRLLGPAWEHWAVLLALTYFAARLVYLATHVAPGIPPDEVTHLGQAELFSGSWLFPPPSSAAFEVGLTARQPFLYGWLMGKLLWLDLTPLSKLVFLRLVNAGLAVATAVYGYKWMRLVTDEAVVRVLFLVLLTNTLMFTGLGATVSYDNLVNLLAAAALYYLAAYRAESRLECLLGFLVAILAGVLTKTAYIPLAGLLLLVLVVGQWNQRRDVPGRLLAWLRSSRWRGWSLSALVVLLAVLAAGFYGANLVQYRSLSPDLGRVVGVENAMRNRIFARSYITGQFRAGALDFATAMRMTERIRDDGDRAAARRMLKRARDPVALEKSLVDVVTYAHLWTKLVISRTYGYSGHRFLGRSDAATYPFYLVLAAALFLCVRRLRLADGQGNMAVAAFVLLTYAAVLAWAVNYRAYLSTGVADLAVQGRYLFPVIVPAYGLTSFYLLARWPRPAQIVIALLVGAWFISGDLPFFLASAGPDWFSKTLP